MSLDPLLAELMVDTITLAGVSSKDAYGKRTWGSATTITNCRVQSGTHKIVDGNGAEIVAEGTVYVPNAPTVTVNSKLTLPDGSTPPILLVDRVGDERGAHHTVLHYGKHRP